MDNLFCLLYYSIAFSFFSMCSQDMKNVHVLVPSKETITLWNYTSNKYFVPISRMDSALPIVSQLRYEVDNCEVVNIESISSELIMFTSLDTLMPGETKKYKLNLFNSDVGVRYDSQLIYKLIIYNENNISTPFNYEEGSETVLLISYRNTKGKLNVIPYFDEIASKKEISKRHFNVCQR